jgi:hypothetical protein
VVAILMKAFLCRKVFRTSGDRPTRLRTNSAVRVRLAKTNAKGPSVSASVSAFLFGILSELIGAERGLAVSMPVDVTLLDALPTRGGEEEIAASFSL